MATVAAAVLEAGDSAAGEKLRVAITGSTGLIGSALRSFLIERGHEVTRVVRSLSAVAPGERSVVWHPAEGTIEAAGLEGHDVVIHLAGESIAGLWTDAKKRRIRESRVRGTSLLARTLAGLERPPDLLLSASGFNYYGDRDPQQRIDESSPAGEGFLADVCREWEAATRPAEEAGIRVVHMRSGTVLSPDGGMLGVLLPLFKLGLGGKVATGRQMLPWIALADVPSAAMHVIQHRELRGPVNFTAPEAVTNEEFTRTLAGVLGRPALFTVPAIAAKVVPGHMIEEMLLAGARVVPHKLERTGYSFRYPRLRMALEFMLR